MEDDIAREIDPADHHQLVHDLRVRVLDGEDISAHEMHLIIDQIRAGRRAAGAPAKRGKKTAKGGAKKGEASAPVDLNGILDQEV